ncbi:MAG: hypothetical protein H6739_22145 [Alphaproteobacteria bacterium]|nr:hypothetical protein [Alphaproteobacteria bacterium]
MLPLALTLAAMAVAPLLDAVSRRRPEVESTLDGLVVVVVLGVVLLMVLPFGLSVAGWGALPAMLGGALLAGAARRLPRLGAASAGLAVAGVLLHALIDGAALAAPMGHAHPLSAAVVLHALPVGLAVWRAARRAAGPAPAAALLLLTGLTTAAGYGAAGQVIAVAQAPAAALVLCGLAGALLHVVGHLHGPGVRRAEGFGALAGAAVVGWLVHHEHGVPLAGPELAAEEAFLALAVEAGPALLVGFGVAGLLRSFGRPGREAAGLALGVPLLGPPVAALWAAAMGVMALGLPPQREGAPVLAGRLRAALRFGFVETVDRAAPWILAGLGAGALLEPLLPADALAGFPAEAAVVTASLLGAPLTVGAAALVPLVAVLMHKGLSAGAAVALLLVAPRHLGDVRSGAWIVGLSMGAGLLVDGLLPALQAPGLHAAAAHAHGPVERFSAGFLLALGVTSLLRQGTGGFLGVLRAEEDPRRTT